MAKKTEAATVSPRPRLDKDALKGPSTCDFPVAVTWAVCVNATVGADGTPPARQALMKAACAEGVGYYTARTQVDKFLRWWKGSRLAQDAPRDLDIDFEALADLEG